jgi:aerobic C4-dicarboxylate transport protein
MTFRSAAKSLYAQVLVAIAIGALIGWRFPHTGEALKPLGDAFIKLIKMLIAPIVFSTIVVGIAGMGDLRKAGRVGLKSIAYFEIVTTAALAIGLVVANVLRPGEGIHASPASLDASALNEYTQRARVLHGAGHLLHVIPDTLVGAFAEGEILQVLLVAVLFGIALAQLGERGRPMIELCDQLAHALFRVVGIIMRLAPIGALGAIAFTVGRYGVGALRNLAELMAAFYLTAALFILLVLGGITHGILRVSFARFLWFIRAEILVVLGTSSSESVLPRMIEKMELLGCSRSVVSMVIPTGYSFNLDGTSIYLTMAALFVAQATGTQLSLTEQLEILAVLLLTSKGAAAVTGGGFITLAATLSSTGRIPVAGLALLLGVDRFMSEARAITNLIGNGVATMVVAKWEGEFDAERARKVIGQFRD